MRAVLAKVKELHEPKNQPQQHAQQVAAGRQPRRKTVRGENNAPRPLVTVVDDLEVFLLRCHRDDVEPLFVLAEEVGLEILRAACDVVPPLHKVRIDEVRGVVDATGLPLDARNLIESNLDLSLASFKVASVKWEVYLDCPLATVVRSLPAAWPKKIHDRSPETVKLQP